MRPTALLVLLLAAPAFADCPPDCVPGGGPAPTDCFVVWGGVPSTTVTCADGDPSCDLDGAADGVCTLGLQACINVPTTGCTPGRLDGAPSVKPAKHAAARALADALAVLTAADPAASACTPPSLSVPLGVSLRGIKPGKLRLTATAASGGKRDRDRLRLACQPSRAAPSFTQQIQPIFTQRCAYAGCHDTFFRGGGMALDPSAAHAEAVGVRSTLGKRPRVRPGSIRGSELARRILGQGIARFGTHMPQGCPGNPPAGGCLTDEETFAILSWIANGAPSD